MGRSNLLVRIFMVLLALAAVAGCGDGDGGSQADGGSDDGGTDGGGPGVEAGACAGFGVTDPVPIPDTCPLEVADDGDTVRVFAVGQVVRYAEMTDYAAFCRTWDEVVRTQVVPCLADDKPNLLVFPENATLSAAFIGSRGAQARAATDTTQGFTSFFVSYAVPLAFYRDRFPGVPVNRQLVVALSDTFHRAFETFHAIARTYAVHVAVSSDFAPAERSRDPDAVAALADPDLGEVDEVWVATEPEPKNWGVFIGPDGEETARVAKAYLVPDEEDLLQLVHGSLADMRPVDLPFARAGMVISKDAWMPDVLHRLDVLGADLTLQPEAFSGWAVEQYEGDWLPDVMRAAGWAHTQRASAFRYNVTPCIKGNLLGLVYDCQSHVAKDARPDDPPRAFIGQPDYPGLLAVEPWVIEDPGPPLSLEERRAVLRERGEAMLPGAGGPLEDAYSNQVIAAELFLAEDGAQPAFGDGEPGAFGASAVVLEPASPEAHQRFPAVAADGDRVLVAFGEGTRAGGRLRVALSEDGGARFAEVDFFASLPGEAVRRVPAVAVAGDRLLVAWEAEDPGAGRATVQAGWSLDGGATWQTAGFGDAAPAWDPAVAVDAVTGTLYVAWLDLRLGERPKPWLARSTDGAAWESVQVDPANDVTDGPRGDAAFVGVAAADGTVQVVFTDFRAYAWDVYRAASADGGATFAPAERVNPAASTVTPVGGGAPREVERVHGYPSLALAPDATPVVAYSDLEDRRPDRDVILVQDGVRVRVDDADPRVDTFRPDLALSADGAAWVVWQDLRSGAPHVRAALRPAGAADFGPSAPVDDAAPAAHVVGPRVAARTGGAVVVLEDWRSGYGRVRRVTAGADGAP